MYEIHFEANETGRQRYELCYQAIAQSQLPIPVTDWDTVADLVRKIKKAGQSAKEKGLYDLLPGGAKVTLEKAEMAKLKEFIAQPIWRPMFLDNVIDLQKWLESAKSK